MNGMNDGRRGDGDGRESAEARDRREEADGASDGGERWERDDANEGAIDGGDDQRGGQEV